MGMFSTKNSAEDTSPYKAPMNLIRSEKKKVESDAQLLANRIALLKAEMDKAEKKIKETKKKTDTIQQLQSENERKFKEKKEMALQKHAEIEISTEKNEQFKNKIQLNLAKTATKIITNKRQDADELKTAREHHAQLIQEAQNEKQRHAEQVRNQIQKDRDEKRRKKEEAEQAKKEAARILFETKLRQEEDARIAKLKEVERLEREEMELIAKLQKTQIEQKKAFDVLEEALNTSKSSFVHNARVTAGTVNMLRNSSSKCTTPKINTPGTKQAASPGFNTENRQDSREKSGSRLSFQ